MNWPGRVLIIMLIALSIVVAYFAIYNLDINPLDLQSSLLDSSRISEPKQDSIPKIEYHELTGLRVGENLNLVIANCTVCHSAKLITQNRATAEGWKSMIIWMQNTQKLWDLGENEDKIIEYLSTYYAPVEQSSRRAQLKDIEWYKLE